MHVLAKGSLPSSWRTLGFAALGLGLSVSLGLLLVFLLDGRVVTQHSSASRGSAPVAPVAPVAPAVPQVVPTLVPVQRLLPSRPAPATVGPVVGTEPGVDTA